MYIKLFNGTKASFLSINLVKLHKYPKLGGLVIKSLFFRETETTKVLNLFDLYNTLLKDANIHYNSIFIFLNFSQNLYVNPYKNIEFFGKCSIY